MEVLSVAIGGLADTNAASAPEKRCAEKNTPERIHIGIITVFIRPDAASMVWAREAISNPRALNASDPKTHSTARSSMEPRTGT